MVRRAVRLLTLNLNGVCSFVPTPLTPTRSSHLSRPKSDTRVSASGHNGVDRGSATLLTLSPLLGLLAPSFRAVAQEEISAPKPAARHSVDFSAFEKQLFNLPPSVLKYPDWLEGTWDVKMKFAGGISPLMLTSPPPGQAPITKERIYSDSSLAGFRRLSVVMVPDVGRKEWGMRLRFQRQEDEGGSRVVEDKPWNLREVLDTELGEGAVKTVEYDPVINPNRCTVNLKSGASPNAQRIELFWNSRSALPPPAGEDFTKCFRCVEDIRQVMISSRLAEKTIIGDYRSLWEFYRGDDGLITCYLSTGAYPTPQDALFQFSGNKPAVIYFHQLYMTPAPPEGPAVSSAA